MDNKIQFEGNYKGNSKGDIKRKDAHQYEKEIQNLIEKIDILESRIKLITDQKMKITTKLKDVEDENEMLKDQISRQHNTNKNFIFDKEKFEKRIEELKLSNKAINDNAVYKIDILNKKLEEKETAVDKLNQQLKAKDETIKYYTVNNEKSQRNTNVYIDDLEQQKAINKKQEEKISFLERQLNQFYIQGQSEGSLLLEIDHLKEDNIRLLQILKSTDEFKDFAYLSETSQGGVRYIGKQREKSESYLNIKESNRVKGKSISRTQKDIFDITNWVPNDAFNIALNFKNKYNLDISESVFNDFIRTLNKIWIEREKKQIIQLKAKYQTEIYELKRKLSMKTGYDQYTSITKISNLKKELRKVKDSLRDNVVLNHKLQTCPFGIELVEETMKVALASQHKHKILEDQIDGLKKQLCKKDNKNYGMEEFYNQGCYCMAGKSLEEVELIEKNFNELYLEYQERVRSVNENVGENMLLDYNIKIVNNAVKWLFTNIKELIGGMKEKFSNWKHEIKKDDMDDNKKVK